jgi:hypothetical protein
MVWVPVLSRKMIVCDLAWVHWIRKIIGAGCQPFAEPDWDFVKNAVKSHSIALPPMPMVSSEQKSG